MEYKEGNTLIDKFMDRVVTPTEYSSIIFINNGYYHKDWNWLMPVVIKINSLNILEMDDVCGSLKIKVKGSLYGIGDNTNMDTVWNAVVNFLKLYLK
jgi:hypothetical protein